MDLRMGWDVQRPEPVGGCILFSDAVNNYLTSDSYQGLLALVDAGIPVDELNRGIVDYYAGQYGVATQAFDRYLNSAPADPASAQYYYGLALRQLGGYAEAINHWDAVIQNYPDHRFWDDAWEQKAYTQWAYQDQFNPAITTLLDFVATSANHPCWEFLHDAAQVVERDGQLARAGSVGQVSIKYPNTKTLPVPFLAGTAVSPEGLPRRPAKLRGLPGAGGQPGRAALPRRKDTGGCWHQAAAQADWQQAQHRPDWLLQRTARGCAAGAFTPPQAFDSPVICRRTAGR
jgi:tetratricopeptide (TPR) repeat protein